MGKDSFSLSLLLWLRDEGHEEWRGSSFQPGPYQCWTSWGLQPNKAARTALAASEAAYLSHHAVIVIVIIIIDGEVWIDHLLSSQLNTTEFKMLHQRSCLAQLELHFFCILPARIQCGSPHSLPPKHLWESERAALML